MQRILSNLNGDPLAALKETLNAIRQLISGVPNETLMKRPSADPWSVSEIVAHLADSELVVAFRYRKTLSESGSAIVAYDQNAWATNLDYITKDPHQSVEELAAVRDINLRLLRSLDSDQWHRYGVHAERGKETVEQLCRLIAGHDINHLKQIEKIVAS